MTETSPSVIGEMPYAPWTHVVKQGETVFSISRQYNIPLETIYANHPSAKYGIKAGEVIELKQAPQTSASGNGYIYYNVKSGDTLFSLAQQYNTSVEDILRCNPGVTEDNFKAGSTVRISADPARRATRTEVVEEQKVAAVDNYKVKKNDTWDAISKQTGVDKTTLKEANENIAKPRKDDVIVVPKVETVKVEREVVAQDPREATPEGREELYDSIHNVVDAAYLPQVNVALLMDDPSSKRDLEFSRGILLAIDELKKAPYKINFKIIDGRVSTTAVLDQLEDFEPNLLLTTADKNFPAFLADYGNENHVEIVNVFDVKNDLFEDNPSVIQLLPPSSLFNDEVGEYVGKAYGG
ncbi:MAG: LysM peptidoglycan-binding domain-containing protein, partial [Muribaculaceae bacterium]|nr:LysM peptidoglycan-binding domain-containing protein [Muribaculaceae bacterium]